MTNNPATDIVQYSEFPGFADYYLEDGFVLKLVSTKDKVEFDLEVVLRASHPQFHSPYDGEQHCYGFAKLTFHNPRSVHWERVRIAPMLDPDGTIDFGNIDQLWLDPEAGYFYLDGDWGAVRIEGDCPKIQFTEVR